MRIDRQDKPRKEWPIQKKKMAVVVAGVLALVVVFGVLALTHEKLNYDEAKESVTEILTTKEALTKFFDAKPKSLEFSDEEKKIIGDFESALEKCRDYMTSLEASNTMKDEAVKEKYDAVKAKYDQLVDFGSIWSDTKLLLDMTDENLAKLKKSKSGALKELAEELIEYRAEVAEFTKKYESATTRTKEEIEAYGKMQLIGDDLNKKYAELSLDKILGMSRDDILGFYATIEELNNLLSEKV